MDGEPGLIGLPGMPGPQGDIGPVGPIGSKGFKGNRGLPGITLPGFAQKGEGGDIGMFGLTGGYYYLRIRTSIIIVANFCLKL